MKKTATAMNSSPDQKSFGDRIRIDYNAPARTIAAFIRTGHASHCPPMRRLVARRLTPASIRLDLSLLDDGLESRSIVLDARRELGRTRRHDDCAAARLALLDVSQGDEHDDLRVALVHHHARNAFRCQD